MKRVERVLRWMLGAYWVLGVILYASTFTQFDMMGMFALYVLSMPTIRIFSYLPSFGLEHMEVLGNIVLILVFVINGYIPYKIMLIIVRYLGRRLCRPTTGRS